MVPSSFGPLGVPLGKHPGDQALGTACPVDFQLERLHTHLSWTAEHLASFEECREVNPDLARSELACLRDSVKQSHAHFDRLIDLLQAGYRPTFGNHLKKVMDLWRARYAPRLGDHRNDERGHNEE